MMTRQEAHAATLEQLTDELAAAGWDSTQRTRREALDAVLRLLDEVERRITFDAYGATLYVLHAGSVYESPCNGTEHAELADAMRVELESFVRDSGDDPEDCEEEIEAIINRACGISWVVEVKAFDWTRHSSHPTEAAAIDQADMVGGRVVRVVDEEQNK